MFETTEDTYRIKTAAETQEQNRNFIDILTSGDEGMLKRAADLQQTYTRLRLREVSWFDKVIPPTKIDRASLNRWPGFNQGVYIQEMEMDTPVGTTVPYNVNGDAAFFVQSHMYPCQPEMLQSPRMIKDTRELALLKMDLRQILMDQLVKDLCGMTDYRTMRVVNFILGPRDSHAVKTDNVQYRHIPGGMTPANLAEAEYIIPASGSEGWGLNTKTILVNNLTIKDIMKWNIIQASNDFAFDVLKNGISSISLHGYDWIVTIKKKLVPTGSIFMFTSPDFLGVNIVTQDVTVTIKQEKFFIEFDALREQGIAFGNTAGIARADFYN